MNTASRLEAANKALETNVLASREAMLLSGLDWWRPMGRVRLRGRSTPVDLFEPAPEFPAEERAVLAQRLAAFDGEDAVAQDAARERLKAMVNRHPDDAAMARSEEHRSELQSLMRISYAVLCW